MASRLEVSCKAWQGQLRYGESFAFNWPDGRLMLVDPRMEANGAVLGNVIFGGIGETAIYILTGRLVMNSRHVHAAAADWTAPPTAFKPPMIGGHHDRRAEGGGRRS